VRKGIARMKRVSEEVSIKPNPLNASLLLSFVNSTQVKEMKPVIINKRRKQWETLVTPFFTLKRVQYFGVLVITPLLKFILIMRPQLRGDLLAPLSLLMLQLEKPIGGGTL
jgi:hypothetical protein